MRFCALCTGAAGTWVCGECVRRCGVKSVCVDPDSPALAKRTTYGVDLAVSSPITSPGRPLEMECPGCGVHGRQHSRICLDDEEA